MRTVALALLGTALALRAPTPRVARRSLPAAATGDPEALTPLPRGIGPYEVSGGTRSRPRSALMPAALRAINAAVSAGVAVGEVEFPPLLGEKTAFDDVDNVQILDANRDWASECLTPLAADLGGKLWVAYPDRKELELAREAWPGAAYNVATLTTVEDAAERLSGASAAAWGAAFAAAAEKLSGANLLGAAPDTSGAPAPTVLLAVQPGEGGPVEDWLNLEKCGAADGALVVSLNGAFDKLRGGAYPRLLFPKLADCVDRFVVGAEPLVYLKPLAEKGNAGWLFRVYPEKWQLHAQGRTETELVATYDARPTFAVANDALLRAPTPP